MGVQKTITILILILIGIFLKKKIQSKEQLSGIKVIILSVALPATIFIGLLKVDITTSLVFLPVMALCLNFLMLGGTKIFAFFLNYLEDRASYRTLLLLLPSFAPGLSCFPFLTEYLGEESLAIGALADVGNKVFGLIILYLLAMTWHYRQLRSDLVKKTSDRYKKLFISLLGEPINIVIFVAITMLCVGLNFHSLPRFGQEAISKLSIIMTPLVLIFIGIAVKVGKSDVFKILQILFWRSAFAFLLSAVLLLILPANLSPLTMLVAVAFPQSSCSFWPFAHMAAVGKLDQDSGVKTFNLDLAVNILAFSLPFSTIIILTICSSGTFFVNPQLLFFLAAVFIAIAMLPYLLNLISKPNTRLAKRPLSQEGL